MGITLEIFIWVGKIPCKNEFLHRGSAIKCITLFTTEIEISSNPGLVAFFIPRTISIISRELTGEQKTWIGN